MPKYKIIYKLFCTPILIFLINSNLQAQKNITVRGQITELSSGEVIPYVTIVYNSTAVGYSDEDGKYSISVPNDAEIFFSKTNYNDYKVKVKNRQVIDIQMTEKALEIDEVIVVGKISKKKISVEPTDLDVVGNHFHLKTKFRVPKEVFTSNKRFIVQPTLYNATTKNTKYFRPVVIDGKIYDINKERHHSFDTSKDRLFNFKVDNTLASTDHIYAYKDSIYVDFKDIDHDYKADCYLVVNGLFQSKKDYQDTVTIAKGTKNPLRFLDYSFAPLELDDPSFHPRPEMKLMSDIGISRINFMVGKAEIDHSNEANHYEIKNIKEKIHSILNDENATLQSIEVTGHASPEGNYQANIVLARKRTELILKELSSSLPESEKKYINLTSKSIVEPWSKVAELLEKDSSYLAKEVNELVSKYKDNHDNIQQVIRRNKDYNPVIVNQYLTLLRKVEYRLNYSIFRELTDDEIWKRYQNKDSNLSRYEYWRLIETAKDERVQNDIESVTLEKYPNFLLIANRKAVKLLKNDSLNTAILQPCLNEKSPVEVIYNQSLMLLGMRDIETADSLVALLPSNENTAYLKAIINTLNGDYESSYPLIASKGGLNEILLLLCMDRSLEALEKTQSMANDPLYNNSAKFWYVRAICTNRTEDLPQAMMSLERAITLDPSLEEVAKLDSDVMDILEIIRP